jgi:hypothetical protein
MKFYIKKYEKKEKFLSGMNLFLLSKNLKHCAKYHCDRHVVKMILEYAQLLSTVFWVLEPKKAEKLYEKGIIYKKTHINHPVSIWAREHPNNYKVIARLGVYLTREYTYRYGKIHKTTPKLLFFRKTFPKFSKCDKKLSGPWNTTESPQCFGEGNDYLKDCNVIRGYRNYYNNCKSHLFSWKNRPAPKWIKEIDN